MSDFKNRQSAEILNSIYRNAEMAYESTGDIMKRCRNTKFYGELAAERERYKNVARQTRTELSRRGETPKSVPPYAKTMAKMSIAMQTANNKSSANLAKIMVRGTTMGIIDMQHAVTRSHAAEQSIRDDSEELLRREQAFCDHLKRYL